MKQKPNAKQNIHHNYVPVSHVVAVHCLSMAPLALRVCVCICYASVRARVLCVCARVFCAFVAETIVLPYIDSNDN